MEIIRKRYIDIINSRFDYAPVIALLGPRQCGKTTLAWQFSKVFTSEIHFFDCEDPRDMARLENPVLALEGLNGLIVIDEIQLLPSLFNILRVLVDNDKTKKFLILGSASLHLIQKSAETLAGRISFVELSGFSFKEIKETELTQLWIKGGFPLSFINPEKSSFQWRTDYIRTYIERDIPNLGIKIPAASLRRFWTMLSHYHGQVFNASEIGKSLGLNDKTIKRYLDILSGTFIIRQLQPWFYNTKKRLIKRPKIYFRDSGLYHSFLNIENLSTLQTHPKLGASWEGFAIEQVIAHFNLMEDEVFFWSVHTGAELDLVIPLKGKLWGVEVKYKDAPKLTKSMISALDELKLEHLWAIYPGEKNYPIHEKITAVGFKNIEVVLKI